MAVNLNPVSTQNPRRRVVVVNANSGAYVLIQPTGSCRYMQIQECPPNAGAFTGSNYAPQGLNYTKGDDGFVAIFGLNPGDILSLGDNSWERNQALACFATATDPAGQTIPQTEQAQVKVQSATGTATQVMVLEYE